jgi:hypothetical protein
LDEGNCKVFKIFNYFKDKEELTFEMINCEKSAAHQEVKSERGMN